MRQEQKRQADEQRAKLLATQKARADLLAREKRAAEDRARQEAEKEGRSFAVRIGDVMVSGLGIYSEHDQKMGRFELQKDMRNLRAVYKNRRGCVLYFNQEKQCWTIEVEGKDGGSTPPLELDIKDLAPIQVRAKTRKMWAARRVNDEGDEARDEFPSMTVEPASEYQSRAGSVAKKIGDVLLYGLGAESAGVQRMGIYCLHPEMIDLRPCYVNTTFGTLFLFYNEALASWCISEENGNVEGRLMQVRERRERERERERESRE